MSFSPPSGGKVAGRPDQRQVVAGRMRSKSSPRDEGPPLVLRGDKVLRVSGTNAVRGMNGCRNVRIVSTLAEGLICFP